MHGDDIPELLRLLHSCFALRKWYKKVDGLAREVQHASLAPLSPRQIHWDQAFLAPRFPHPKKHRPCSEKSRSHFHFLREGFLQAHSHSTFASKLCKPSHLAALPFASRINRSLD